MQFYYRVSAFRLFKKRENVMLEFIWNNVHKMISFQKKKNHVDSDNNENVLEMRHEDNIKHNIQWLCMLY